MSEKPLIKDKKKEDIKIEGYNKDEIKYGVKLKDLGNNSEKLKDKIDEYILKFENNCEKLMDYKLDFLHDKLALTGEEISNDRFDPRLGEESGMDKWIVDYIKKIIDYFENRVDEDVEFISQLDKMINITKTLLNQQLTTELSKDFDEWRKKYIEDDKLNSKLSIDGIEETRTAAPPAAAAAAAEAKAKEAKAAAEAKAKEAKAAAEAKAKAAAELAPPPPRAPAVTEMISAIEQGIISATPGAAAALPSADGGGQTRLSGGGGDKFKDKVLEIIDSNGQKESIDLMEIYSDTDKINVSKLAKDVTDFLNDVVLNDLIDPSVIQTITENKYRNDISSGNFHKLNISNNINLGKDDELLDESILNKKMSLWNEEDRIKFVRSFSDIIWDKSVSDYYDAYNSKSEKIQYESGKDKIDFIPIQYIYKYIDKSSNWDILTVSDMLQMAQMLTRPEHEDIEVEVDKYLDRLLDTDMESDETDKKTLEYDTSAKIHLQILNKLIEQNPNIDIRKNPANKGVAIKPGTGIEYTNPELIGSHIVCNDFNTDYIISQGEVDLSEYIDLLPTMFANEFKLFNEGVEIIQNNIISYIQRLIQYCTNYIEADDQLKNNFNELIMILGIRGTEKIEEEEEEEDRKLAPVGGTYLIIKSLQEYEEFDEFDETLDTHNNLFYPYTGLDNILKKGFSDKVNDVCNEIIDKTYTDKIPGKNYWDDFKNESEYNTNADFIESTWLNTVKGSERESTIKKLIEKNYEDDGVKDYFDRIGDQQSSIFSKILTLMNGKDLPLKYENNLIFSLGDEEGWIGIVLKILRFFIMINGKTKYMVFDPKGEKIESDLECNDKDNVCVKENNLVIHTVNISKVFINSCIIKYDEKKISILEILTGLLKNEGLIYKHDISDNLERNSINAKINEWGDTDVMTYDKGLTFFTNLVSIITKERKKGKDVNDRLISKVREVRPDAVHFLKYPDIEHLVNIDQNISVFFEQTRRDPTVAGQQVAQARAKRKAANKTAMDAKAMLEKATKKSVAARNAVDQAQQKLTAFEGDEGDEEGLGELLKAKGEATAAAVEAAAAVDRATIKSSAESEKSAEASKAVDQAETAEQDDTKEFVVKKNILKTEEALAEDAGKLIVLPFQDKVDEARALAKPAIEKYDAAVIEMTRAEESKAVDTEAAEKAAKEVDTAAQDLQYHKLKHETARKNIEELENLVNVENGFGDHEALLTSMANEKQKITDEREVIAQEREVWREVGVTLASKKTELEVFIKVRENQKTLNNWNNVISGVYGQKIDRKSGKVFVWNDVAAEKSGWMPLDEAKRARDAASGNLDISKSRATHLPDGRTRLRPWQDVENELRVDLENMSKEQKVKNLKIMKMEDILKQRVVRLAKQEKFIEYFDQVFLTDALATLGLQKAEKEYEDLVLQQKELNDKVLMSTSTFVKEEALVAALESQMEDKKDKLRVARANLVQAEEAEATKKATHAPRLARHLKEYRIKLAKERADKVAGVATAAVAAQGGGGRNASKLNSYLKYYHDRIDDSEINHLEKSLEKYEKIYNDFDQLSYENDLIGFKFEPTTAVGPLFGQKIEIKKKKDFEQLREKFLIHLDTKKNEIKGSLGMDKNEEEHENTKILRNFGKNFSILKKIIYMTSTKNILETVSTFKDILTKCIDIRKKKYSKLNLNTTICINNLDIVNKILNIDSEEGATSKVFDYIDNPVKQLKFHLKKGAESKFNRTDVFNEIHKPNDIQKLKDYSYDSKKKKYSVESKYETVSNKSPVSGDKLKSFKMLLYGEDPVITSGSARSIEKFNPGDSVELSIDDHKGEWKDEMVIHDVKDDNYIIWFDDIYYKVNKTKFNNEFGEAKGDIWTKPIGLGEGDLVVKLKVGNYQYDMYPSIKLETNYEPIRYLNYLNLKENIQRHVINKRRVINKLKPEEYKGFIPSIMCILLYTKTIYRSPIDTPPIVNESVYNNLIRLIIKLHPSFSKPKLSYEDNNEYIKTKSKYDANEETVKENVQYFIEHDISEDYLNTFMELEHGSIFNTDDSAENQGGGGVTGAEYLNTLMNTSFSTGVEDKLPNLTRDGTQTFTSLLHEAAPGLSDMYAKLFPDDFKSYVLKGLGKGAGIAGIAGITAAAVTGNLLSVTGGVLIARKFAKYYSKDGSNKFENIDETNIKEINKKLKNTTIIDDKDLEDTIIKHYDKYSTEIKEDIGQNQEDSSEYKKKYLEIISGIPKIDSVNSYLVEKFNDFIETIDENNKIDISEIDNDTQNLPNDITKYSVNILKLNDMTEAFLSKSSITIDEIFTDDTDPDPYTIVLNAEVLKKTVEKSFRFIRTQHLGGTTSPLLNPQTNYSSGRANPGIHKLVQSNSEVGKDDDIFLMVEKKPNGEKNMHTGLFVDRTVKEQIDRIISLHGKASNEIIKNKEKKSNPNVDADDDGDIKLKYLSAEGVKQYTEIFKKKVFSSENLCKNVDDAIQSQYHIYIGKEMDELEQSPETGYSFIDHFIFKCHLYYLINLYFENIKELNDTQKKLNKSIADSAGRSIGIAERLGFKGLLNETRIVIEKLREHGLTHKINPIYKYGKNTLTVGYFISLDDRGNNGRGGVKRQQLVQKLDFSKTESINLGLVIADVYDYYLSKLKKDKVGEKKTKKKFEFDFSNEKEKKDARNQLTKGIMNTGQSKDSLYEKLKLIEKLKNLQNEQTIKMKNLIEKYENESILNDKKLQELQRINDITSKNTKELIKEINKNKNVRREISVKTRELLIDRLKQLQKKKQIEEASIAELTITNEKLKISIAEFKINSDKKEKELREIDKIKTDLINDGKLLQLNRLKMALTESTLQKKEKKLLLRDREIMKKISDLKSKTIKKNIPIFFDPSMKKTKRKIKKKNNRKTKSKVVS